MNQTEYIRQIREFLAAGRLEDALKILLQFVRELGEDYPLNTANLLSGRYFRWLDSLNTGRTSQADFDAESEGVQKGIQDLLVQIETAPRPEPLRNPREKGRLIHNIPGRMFELEEIRCTVRIAKDDQTLLQNFPKNETATPQDIEIGRSMSVELIDPHTEKAFDIRPVSSVEQTVGDGDFTQWIFFVRPLHKGQFNLMLKVMILEKGAGGTERKEIVLEQPIEVTSVDQLVFSGISSSSWSSTQYVFQYSGSRAWLWPLALPATKDLRTLLLSACIVMTGLLLVLLLRYTPAPPAPFLTAVLRTNPDLAPAQVSVNGLRIRKWTTNPDRSEVTLPPLPAGRYWVSVKGAGGICQDSIQLTSASTRFRLMCDMTPPPPPAPDSFLVTLFTAFRTPEVWLDQAALGRQQQSEKLGHEKYRSALLVPAGEHQFRVGDPARKFKCPSLEITALIRQDTALKFTCKPIVVPPKRYTVRLSVPNPTGDRNQASMKVMLDGHLLSIKAMRATPKDVVFVIPDVAKGGHRFELTGLMKGYGCGPLSVDVQKDISLSFNCDLSYTMTLTVPANASAAKAMQKAQIVVDDKVLKGVTGKPGPAGWIFVVPNLSRGNHKFQLKVSGNFGCEDIIELVNTDMRRTFRCAVGNPGLQ